jgi:Flp pilus assembly protein TadB
MIRLVFSELVGMFVDDGNLALLALILIALIAAAVKVLGLPPLVGGVLLLAGCLAILLESTRRAARGQAR